MVIFFNPLNRRVQGTIDRLFFRQKFDYKEAVIKISDALSSVLDLEQLVGQITGAMRTEMFIDNAGVIVLDQQSRAPWLFRHGPGQGGGRGDAGRYRRGRPGPRPGGAEAGG